MSNQHNANIYWKKVSSLFLIKWYAVISGDILYLKKKIQSNFYKLFFNLKLITL